MQKSLADAGDDKSLEEKLQSCSYFLVNSEILKVRHIVFNLLSTTLQLRLSKKNWIAFWIK